MPGMLQPIRRAGRTKCVVRALLILLLASSVSAEAGAADPQQELATYVRSLPGGLDSIDTPGFPPALEVRQDGRLYGYAFSTLAVSGSLGYSGRPLDIHAVLTTDGRIADARLARHEEPILVIGIPAAALEAFVRGLRGLDIREPLTPRRSTAGPDHVAGATVSSAVIRDAVVRSARAVARSRGMLGGATQRAQIDHASFVKKSWPELIAEGAIAHRSVRRAEVSEVLGTGEGAPEAAVIDIYAALLSPPTIGQNLLGRRLFERLEGQTAVDGAIILIAARGLYSLKGTEWRQSGIFDRIQIVQGAKTLRLTGEQHENIERLAAEGAPELREIAAFRIPSTAGFDAAAPWRLDLIVADEAGQRSVVFPLEYRLPTSYFTVRPVSAAQEAPDPELWQQIWRSRTTDIVIVTAMLVALAAILFAHDGLVRDVRRYRQVRVAFLAVTLVFLGLYAGAQLSVVNVVVFAHAVLSGFRWEQFLIDPLIFILWSFVALALLFWGRGVFCGWLCPFGALQELLNGAARRLGVRQIEVPWALHERLWPIKYIAFLVILGVSFKSIPDSFALAEVEPFKTALVMNFARAWPFVLYALTLLAAGLFIERFYCRYLCPLGAALAIPARLRLFEWLKRRPQCGRECRICAVRCTVQAINPLGQIVPNECIYCLQCQANYYDPTTCLPLKQRAQRRAGIAVSSAASQKVGMENDDA